MGFTFSPNEGLVIGLAMLFAFLLGMALVAGGGRKHKLRYREENKRATELERENVKLRKELKEAHHLPGSTAAARDERRV
ncbi:MAG: hypothetical protein JWL74_660 [Alphaproteobacteria bacterium]|jgi:hypothetical protein|nr:hypothetical protein [Alphaproteobacteria bacterium]